MGGEVPRLGGFSFTLQDLEMKKQLGKGSAGNVHLAVHKPTGTKMAVKVVNAYDEQTRQQIFPELQALLGMECDCIVQLHDAFFDQGKICLALEYMNAGSLDSLLKQNGPPPEAALLAIAHDLLNGLHYLHVQRRQVHRDLKPENVLCDKNGAVKIADLGISKKLMESAPAVGTFVGTAVYMAPERLNSEEYSFSSDIWSLGVMLIELATGKHPFVAGSASFFDLLTTIMSGPAPLPNKGMCSEELEMFLSMCLQKDPKHRPSAAILLEHDWLAMHLEERDEALYNWINSPGESEPPTPMDGPPALSWSAAGMTSLRSHIISGAELPSPPVSQGADQGPAPGLMVSYQK